MSRLMQKIITQLPEIKLVGITCRTNNSHIRKKNSSLDGITPTVQKYFNDQFSTRIINRKSPGITYCAYTDYESDFNGDYTFFIGEEVTLFENTDEEEMQELVIPTQKYAKFTNQSGPMPTVCLDMWKSIWKMKPYDLGGLRSYVTDFELYDQRSTDYYNTVLDIYIGLK